MIFMISLFTPKTLNFLNYLIHHNYHYSNLLRITHILW